MLPPGIAIAPMDRRATILLSPWQAWLGLGASTSPLQGVTTYQNPAGKVAESVSKPALPSLIPILKRVHGCSFAEMCASGCLDAYEGVPRGVLAGLTCVCGNGCLAKLMPRWVASGFNDSGKRSVEIMSE